MPIRALFATLVLAIAVAAPAAANPPDGNWTFVRKDAFKHYACKAKGAKEGRWKVKTVTWFNNRAEAIEERIGVYGTVVRGGNKNEVTSRDVRDWEGGYIRLVLRGAEESDRLWIQGSYYGPPEPWSDGFRVERLKRC
jgi:hypothetical protein